MKEEKNEMSKFFYHKVDLKKEMEIPKWPEYVIYAFEQAGYEDYELNIEAFVSRWGGLEIETFARVLKEGQGEDRILAIFAIGFTRSPWTRELLLPFLHSAVPIEQCASALCLGKMREEQALPVLVSMLTEFFPPKEWPSFEGDDLWFYNGCRLEALLILAEWARPEIVPALLDALQAFRHLEQLIPEQHTIPRRYWRWCQGRVMYALGWLGRFDVLTTLRAEEPMLSSRKVYLALGYLHAHLAYPDVFTRGFRALPGLREQVMGVLKEQFGLSAEEQEHCLTAYAETNW
jgi:hypothetical protein